MLNVIDTGRMRLVKSLPVSPVLFRYFSCFFEGFTGKYFYISGQGNLVKLNVLDKAKKKSIISFALEFEGNSCNDLAGLFDVA